MQLPGCQTAARKLPGYCQVVASLLAGCCQAAATLVPYCCQTAVRLLPNRWQAAVMLLSGWCQADASKMAFGLQISLLVGPWWGVPACVEKGDFDQSAQLLKRKSGP